jgi:DNA polymerase III subunit delta
MASLNSAKFFAHIDKEELAPAYLLAGEDGFIIDRAAGAILARSVDQATRDFNLDVFYARDSKAEDIVSQAMTLPMMAQRRTILVKEADRLKDLDRIAGYMESPSPDTVLVMVAQGAERSKEAALVKAMGKHAVTAHFYNPSDTEIVRWTARIANEAGYRIDPDASAYLRDVLGDNLALIESELKKVFNFAGERKSISINDMELAVGDFGMPLVFGLVDEVAEKKTGSALETLQRLLRDGEQPLMILGALSRHWRRLIEASERINMGDTAEDIVKRFRLNFKNRDAFLRQIKRLSAKELRAGLIRMSMADKELKGSRLPSDIVMDRLVYDLSCPAAK